jgi:hypothetical protein
MLFRWTLAAETNEVSQQQPFVSNGHLEALRILRFRESFSASWLERRPADVVAAGFWWSGLVSYLSSPSTVGNRFSQREPMSSAVWCG